MLLIMYQIICSTDPYTASRNSKFESHKTSYIVKTFVTLKEAQRELLSIFNSVTDVYLPNWGLVICHYSGYKNGISATSHRNGLRSFEYDAYKYTIEECFEEC